MLEATITNLSSSIILTPVLTYAAPIRYNIIKYRCSIIGIFV